MRDKIEFIRKELESIGVVVWRAQKKLDKAVPIGAAMNHPARTDITLGYALYQAIKGAHYLALGDRESAVEFLGGAITGILTATAKESNADPLEVEKSVDHYSQLFNTLAESVKKAG